MHVKKIRNSDDRFTLVFSRHPTRVSALIGSTGRKKIYPWQSHPNNDSLYKETGGFMKLQHDENITLPETVAHLAEQPLCRIVATWGLLQNHYLNRQRIMQAFNVPRRKAGYILRYIVHSPCITCDQHVYTHPRSHRQELRVWIRTVSQPLPLRTKSTRVRNVDRQSVWAQLLQRPWSELHL